MKKLKNKRHMTIAAILLMLTFLAGAAFAATPGAIQAVGVVGVIDDILRVQWTVADPVANATVAEVNEADITTAVAIITGAGQPNQPALNTHTANARIEWLVGFIDEGTVVLEATAENTGVLDARLYRPTGAAVGALAWFDAFGTGFFDVTVTNPLGGTYTPGAGGAGTWPVILEPGEYVELEVHLELNDMNGLRLALGLSPLGWPLVQGWPDVQDMVDGPFAPGEPLEDYYWANSFVFSLPYVAN